MNRRNFLKKSTLATAASLATLNAFSEESKTSPKRNVVAATSPVLISTWDFGADKHVPGWKILAANGRALDAVEQSVRAIESDKKNTSVGIGGMPDRDGHVTLDACIMDENSNCGSVVFLEHIEHPVSVARMVMEKTPHVYLAGEGALDFALNNGFKKEKVVFSDAVDKAWKKWLAENKYQPHKFEALNHDTVGMLALDANGDLSGACSTSGWAFKLHGRVGDSPMIGAGLFVDNEVGAATGTGLGEAAIKVAGTAIIVELMRNGKTPYEACKIVIERMHKKIVKPEGYTMAFIAVDKSGRYGAFSLRKGFQYSLTINGETKVVNSDYLME